MTMPDDACLNPKRVLGMREFNKNGIDGSSSLLGIAFAT